MYLIIGKENCSSCEMVKTILTNKKIEFEYRLLEEMNEEEKTEYLTLARKKGILSMPLIIKDNQLFNIKEVR